MRDLSPLEGKGRRCLITLGADLIASSTTTRGSPPLSNSSEPLRQAHGLYFLLRLQANLQIVELLVDAARDFHKFFVCPLFDDPPFFNNKNFVGVTHG